MKVGVTGGFGLQGSRLATRLFEQGHYVRIFDNAMSEGAVQPKHDSAVLMDLSKESPDFRDLEAVFHLAARFGGTKVNHGPDEARITLENSRIDANVLDAVVRDRVERFTYASSGSVYPLSALRRRGGQIKETEPLDPFDLESGYACTKLATESVIVRLVKTHAIPKAQVLRLFNVYGPSPKFFEGTHVIPELFKKALSADLTVRVYGDGTQQRYFLYVDDAVDAYLRCLSSPFTGILNIANPELITIGELARKIVKACGRMEKEVVFDLDPTAAVSMPCLPDISLAWSSMTWEPRVTLNEGLKMTRRWIEDNHPAPLR